MYEIFLDSDGVFAGFSELAREKYGKDPDTLTDGGEKKKFWQWLTWYDATVEKFFLNLPKIHDADQLMEFLTANFDTPKCLTASGHTPADVKEQKIEWWAKHYPEIECIVVRKSPDKAQYAHPKAILIDDRMKSIEPWRAAGGIGILHTSAEDTIAQLQSIIGVD